MAWRTVVVTVASDPWGQRYERLAAAWRAVEDLHRPHTAGHVAWCAACSFNDTWTPWPCATIRAHDEAMQVRR